MSITRIDPRPRMSACVVHGNTVYTDGLVAQDTNLGTAGQTRQILERIEALLTEAGSGKARILRANIWLRDITSFEEMNAVWDEWVDRESPPARATVEAKLAKPEFRVEIMVTAAI